LKQIIEDLGLTDRISIEIIGDGKSI